MTPLWQPGAAPFRGPVSVSQASVAVTIMRLSQEAKHLSIPKGHHMMISMALFYRASGQRGTTSAERPARHQHAGFAGCG